MEEIKAWANNTSSILEPDTFQYHEEVIKLSLQQRWLTDVWREDADKVIHLLNVTSLDYDLPDIQEQKSTNRSYAPFSNFTDSHMDTLYEYALTMDEFAHNITKLRIYRLFPKIRQKFATELLARRSELVDELDSLYLISHKLNEQLYQNMTVENGDEIVTPSTVLSLNSVLATLCPVTSPSKGEEAFINRTTIMKFKDLLRGVHNNLCYYKLFLNVFVEQNSCQNTDPMTFLEKMFHSVRTPSGSGSVLVWIVIICTYIYIIIDVFERCVFLTKSVVYQTSLWNIMCTALNQKVPGSYVHKQLNLLSCLAIPLQFYFVKHSFSLTPDNNSTEEFYSYHNLISMVFIIAIVVRFLMHIHSLRLLPGIGH